MDKKTYSLYKELYDKYGISPEAVKAANKKQQEFRFDNLISLTNIEKEDTVLDIGCGPGDLLKYLRKRKLDGFYCGVDFLQEYVDYGNQYFKDSTNSKFVKKDILIENFDEPYDWVLLSGVFNDMRENSEEFFYETIKKMFLVCKKGIAFNSLSKYVDYEDPTLFYTDPAETLRYAAENLSKYILINTNYQLKKDTIPFEYSICIYKK